MCPIDKSDKNSEKMQGQFGDQNGGNHFPPEKGNQHSKARNSGNSGKNPLRIGHGGQPGTRNK